MEGLKTKEQGDAINAIQKTSVKKMENKLDKLKKRIEKLEEEVKILKEKHIFMEKAIERKAGMLEPIREEGWKFHKGTGVKKIGMRFKQ